MGRKRSPGHAPKADTASVSETHPTGPADTGGGDVAAVAGAAPNRAS
jgi:hypothetical protein